MIKKYIMLISAILVILIFTSTSSASFLFPKGNIYERLPENSPLKNILNKFSQVIISNKDNSISIDEDMEDDANNDEDDSEYDDGEHDEEIDPDGPKEDVILPKIWNMVGEKTPDDGDEPVIDSEKTTTIDSDGEVGATQDDEWTVDSDGDEGTTSNDITTSDYIAEGEWTVEAKPITVKLERFVKIVTEINGNLGALLQRVIERNVATDENGVSSSVSGGSVENDIVDNVVLMD